MLEQWTQPSLGGASEPSSAWLVEVLASKLDFMEATYTSYVGFARSEPTLIDALQELRALHPRVGQILEDVEHEPFAAPATTHAGQPTIALSILDRQQHAQRVVDAPRTRLMQYPLVVHAIYDAMPESHPMRDEVRHLAKRMRDVAQNVNASLPFV